MMKRRKGEGTGRVYVKVRMEVSLKFRPISKLKSPKLDPRYGRPGGSS
jgi:hypothetical protein